jgi:Ca-activated chloride channel family protein
VKLEVRSERVAQGNMVHLLLRLTAPEHEAEQRRAAHLALVIDRSSSMRGPRLKQAVHAARELIGRLGPKDRLSIVTFDAAPTVVCDPGPVTDERKLEMEEALDSIVTGVGTNLGAALRTGADLIRKSYVRECIARVLLLTDGQASVGVTDAERLGAMSEAIYKAGVTTTTMGLGQGFDDNLLIDIATRGHGAYYYLADPSDIPAAFGRELEGVFSISAQETKIKLIPHPDIESVELLHKLPCEPLPDGLLIRVGDVSCNVPRQVLFRMSIAEGSTSGTAGKVSVTYKDAKGDTADAHIMGVPLPAESPIEDVQAIVAEDLKLRVANAVDKAWGQRTSGNAGQALLGLRQVHRAVIKESDAGRCPALIAQDLLGDLARAEIAINQGAEERERVRRGLREKSQMTQMGHSVLYKLTPPKK